MGGLLSLFEIVGKQHICSAGAVGEWTGLLEDAAIPKLVQEVVVRIHH